MTISLTILHKTMCIKQWNKDCHLMYNKIKSQEFYRNYNRNNVQFSR